MRRPRMLLLAFLLLAGCTAVRPVAPSFPAQPAATATPQVTLVAPTGRAETSAPAPPTVEITPVDVDTEDATDGPAPTTDPAPQRIHFAPGETGVALSGLLVAWDKHRFV